jgi:hypothetical protein
MGKLTNLNPPAPIADADIPAAIARDSELTATINAHLNALDPHTQYATQARADERYGAIKKYYFSGVTASSQGGSVSIPHGLLISKIVSINALVEHTTGVLVAPGHTFSPGYEFELSLNASGIFVGNIPTKSFNILGKPVRVVVDYSI